MTISDEQLRRALEACVQAAGADHAPSLAAVARAVAVDAPRSASSRWRPGLRWMPAAAAAVLVAAVAVAVLPGTGPTPSASEPPSPSAVPATAVVPSETNAPLPTQTASPSQASLVIEGCSALGFDARRCKAVVSRAVSAEPPIAFASVTRATLSPPGLDEQVSSTYPIADVLLLLGDGTDRQVQVRCGLPGTFDLACNEDARIIVLGGIDHDVTCDGEGGESGTTCATPVPTPRPASVAAARPLRVASLDIPIDHLGHYEVPVGDAGLPDGALTERSGTVVDPRPTTYWLDRGIWIDVRPDDPGRPPVGSVFRTPFKGVETVHVWLVFDVTELDPGGTLQVRDIVVR